jgi:hypothetical protein
MLTTGVMLANDCFQMANTKLKLDEWYASLWKTSRKCHHAFLYKQKYLPKNIEPGPIILKYRRTFSPQSGELATTFLYSVAALGGAS